MQSDARRDASHIHRVKEMTLQLRKIVDANVVAAMLDLPAAEFSEWEMFPAETRPESHFANASDAAAYLIETLPRPIIIKHVAFWFEDGLIDWQRNLDRQRELRQCEPSERESQHVEAAA
jgi:hypothetical protein